MASAKFRFYQAQSMAAHGLSTAVLSAAVRLSVIGHERRTAYSFGFASCCCCGPAKTSLRTGRSP